MLVQGIRAALFWCGAFAFACCWFFAANKLLRGLPPTPAVGIGRVTVDEVSKLRDYAGAALFYLLVPALTILFERAGRRMYAWAVGPLRGRPPELGTVALFILPFLLAPLFFLTTRKELWGILLPPVLGIAAVRAVVMFRTQLSVRALLAPPLRPYHWLLVFETLAWLIFRYLAIGKRIAHIPTLFLEVVFILFFIAAFWAVAFLVARLTSMIFARDTRGVFESFAVGATPLLILPLAGLTLIPERIIVATIYPLAAITILIAIWKERRWTPRSVWRLVAYFAAPVLLFCVSYGSIAQLSQWVDLFHRGESLGPASDYLRGKVPYRDVFVLHGMLENGLLDSWLMRLFGRQVDVALTRLIVIAALTTPLLWLITIVTLESIPLALAAAVLSYVVSADNQRAFPQMIVVLLLLVGVKCRSSAAVLLAGVFSGFGIFYSLDMGIYSVIGGLLTLAVLVWLAEYPRIWIGLFVLGVLAGAAPFLLYLAANRALLDFFEISFVTLPAVIDAVWSLPFPDFSQLFRDFSVRAAADFVLTERFRFILNPLVLGIALTFVLAQLRRGDPSTMIRLLLILLIFSVLTQRSALGRADFQHQYFSAFLLPPILAVLAAALGKSLSGIWRVANSGERALLGSAVVVALSVIVTVLWVPDLLNERLDATTTYRQRVARQGYDPKGEQTADRIRAIRSVVSKLTRGGDTVFDFSNQPALYFFTDRPNPTRFYQVPILSPIAHQMEAIRDLAASRPRVVFRQSPENYHAFDGVENELRARAVAAFIDDHYAFHRNVRGIELWRPLNRPVSSLEHYRRLFVLPPSASLAPEQRFIFPSVGSVHGVGASIWKSDLILHNPHTLPARLRLRYVWSSGARDRELVLFPGQNRQLTDFVSSLFEAPQTRGALWIEFPADRRPLVRVATYEASRGGEPSISAPLFDADAAAADTVLNELTIVGARAEPSTRVNLGVINVGSAPAHFRITATDAGGQIVGVPAESSLYEDQSFLMVDAGGELGVPFQEPVVVHIRMISGKAIGYASLVSSAIGTQDFIPAVPAHAP